MSQTTIDPEPLLEKEPKQSFFNSEYFAIIMINCYVLGYVVNLVCAKIAIEDHQFDLVDMVFVRGVLLFSMCYVIMYYKGIGLFDNMEG